MNLASCATDPAGRSTQLVYDEVGNPVERHAPDGTKLEFAYDARGLRLSRKTPAGAPGTAIADAFAYDRRGRLVFAQNPEATYRLEYDALDRPVAGAARED